MSRQEISAMSIETAHRISKDIEARTAINEKFDDTDQKYRSDDEDTIGTSTWWSRHREYVREPMAEFLGTAILIIFGSGANCSVVLSRNSGVAPFPRGDWLSVSIGWALGVALGVWVSGGISGGHINPAVTLALATFRGFSWKKVPGYIFAQLLGGIVGAAIVYANYFHAIDIYEGGEGVRTLATAGLFGTLPSDYLTPASTFFDEFLGTAVFLIVIFAMLDKKNMPPPNGLGPLILFLVVLGIGSCIGMQTGFAINPARDLGPRILTAMVGYGGAVFSASRHYWIWGGVMAPILGALCGALAYDVLIYTGRDSPVNKPFGFKKRRVSDATDFA